MSILPFRLPRSRALLGPFVVALLPLSCGFSTHGTGEGAGGAVTTTTTSSSSTTTAMTCVPKSVANCYTGPAGTLGKGVCEQGTWVCNDEGTGYGPCADQVVPAAMDDCNTPLDEDCDGVVNQDCKCTPLDTRSCYSGPAGTEGVGVCKGGTQTCGAEETWGPCTGEVLPGVESCATPEDEDCNGHAFDDTAAGCVCQPGSASACDTGELGVCAQGSQICDADGKGQGACTSLVTPKFDDCATLADDDCDGTAIAACTGAPVAVVAEDKTNGDDVAFAVGIDKGGNVIVGGVSNGTASGSIVSGGALFLNKYDANGNALWTGNTSSGAFAVVRNLAVDASDNVLAVGEFRGTINIGGKSMTSNGGGNDVDLFAAKLDTNGSAAWLKRGGNNSAAQYAQAVAVDQSGNAVIAGRYSGSLDLGGGACNLGNSAGGDDAFVVKLSPTGTCVWGKKVGDTDNQGAYGVAVTPTGDVVVTGTLRGNGDFGGGSLASAGSSDVFVAKLAASNGAQLWARRYGDSSSQTALGVAVDPNGDIAVVGSFTGSIDFGNGALTSADPATDDVFVAKLSGSDGSPVWAQRYGDASPQFALRVATDGAGNVVVIGLFQGVLDFGGGALTNADPLDATTDVFVAKLAASNGLHLWSHRYGDDQEQRGRDVAVDGKGAAVIAGGFQGTIDFGAPVGSLTSTGGYDLFAVKLDP
jgi:hypothetical protein